MSEYTSYSTAAMDGGSGRAVQEALNKQGILFRNAMAWSSARKRVEELEKNLTQEMGKICTTSLENNLNSNALKEIVRLDAMVSAFSQVEAFKTFAKAKHGKEFEDIHTTVSKLKSDSLNSGDIRNLEKSAIQSQKRLEKLSVNTQKGLCQVERDVMTDAVTSSLCDLGYSIETRGNALKATSGLNCIWASTNKFGELSLDLSGFSGLSCMKETVKVENELKKHGIILNRLSSRPHNKPEGGKLVKKLRPMFPEFKKITGSKAQIESRIRTKQEMKY